MKKTKLIDIFENPITDGIFSYLADMSPTPPWANDIDGATLNAEYFGNISGQKTISPLLKNIILKNSATNKLTESDVVQLATLVYKLNNKMWVKEYATLNFDYDPISNYDMTETETGSGTTGNTRTNTGTQTDANTGTVSTTHTGTQGMSDTSTASGTSSGSSDRGLYGFNSSESVGDSTDATESETTTTATGNSTRTDNLNDERTDNTIRTRTDNLSESESGTHSDTRTLTRTGNVGVTTSQEMINAERELNMWNYFYSVVFPSVDKVLTICTYS